MTNQSTKPAAIAFKTKARTVDHLGREQIADCPTAISELWKNAYDAYARNTSLNIFDGDNPVAGLFDDGHGMDREEFVNRWLVVGTEAKISNKQSTVKDRLGLKPRIKQGQKGIGRLSCANLGPLLLLVSKRKNCNFVASLLDWRIFENPFLDLNDILIPVIEVKDKEEILSQLSGLFSTLKTNVEGGTDDIERTNRIKTAWKQYDDLSTDRTLNNRPSKLIINSLIQSMFTSRHFEQWSVWRGDTQHGTALLIGEINYDLKIYVDPHSVDAAATSSKEKFFETLSCFVNPFISADSANSQSTHPDFECCAKYWEGELSKTIVGSNKQFTRNDTDQMEHIIDGIINSEGQFVGRVKAFGQWRDETYRLDPPKDLNIPTAKNTKVGPFSLYIATFEFDRSNTTHEQSQWQHFKELATQFSGLMVFRDGLRVMPYGRTDNDFFEIDDRRSRSAGREFWNNRQMFGGLAICQSENPNLKDKAGREGIVDNVAAKTLKALIENILRRSARDYFGNASDIRNQMLTQIREANKDARIREERNKVRRKNTRLFRNRLKDHMKSLPGAASELNRYINNLKINNVKELDEAQDRLAETRVKIVEYKLPGAPKKLGTSEATYFEYKRHITTLVGGASELSDKITKALEAINPAGPFEVYEKHLQRSGGQIHAYIRKWKTSIDELQRSEFERVRLLIDDRNKAFHRELEPITRRVKDEELELNEAIAIIDNVKTKMDSENHAIFPPYISALESLQQSIDLELLATTSDEEIQKLESELERLNSLAQLGISVEIIGHELEAYDDIIGSGLQRLPEEVQNTAAVKDIKIGYDGLTDQLRYLSPLKLSGQRVQRWVSGNEIYQYVQEFFKLNLAKAKITLDASETFKQFRVFDQPSRLYPVFINLVNNSRYWLSQSKLVNRTILFDLVEDEVLISDNGPGVDEENIDNLFSLFFTTKLRGGRGIGLYLCRANLAAGGHRIRYQESNDNPSLDGANFYIWFRGAEFDK